MFSLNTTLLREKFIIRETNTPRAGGLAAPLVAQGNRMALPFISPNGDFEETIIVRAHTMHSTLRMAAALCAHFYREGTILRQLNEAGYAQLWNEARPLFDKNHNQVSWLSLYNGGKCLFSSGEPHAFFEIIELCDAKNRDEYDNAVILAENSFKQSGKAVNIDHFTNIATVLGAGNGKIRLGLILRKPGSSATFNFALDGTARNIKYNNADIAPALLHAANWLELIQLSVTVGFHKSKRGDAIARSAPLPAIQARMGELNAAIGEFERKYAPHYRPDRPDMMGLIEDTAFYARHGKPNY